MTLRYIIGLALGKMPIMNKEECTSKQAIKMSPFLVVRNILSFVAIVWAGSKIGLWLFLLGLIRMNDIPFWSSAIFYIYLLISGLMLAICVFGIVQSSESKNGQLTLKGSEAWLKMLKLWCFQNQAVAAACLIVFLYSMVHVFVQALLVFGNAK